LNNLGATYAKLGRSDEAQTIIDPLLRHTRLHISEFGALMGSQVSICIEQRNTNAAQNWLDMWAQVDPDHPHIFIFRLRLLAAGSRRRSKR
jgi:hypothetical protein